MVAKSPGPEVIKLFSCSTKLSTKFQLLIKTKILMFVAVFLGYNQYWPGGFMVLWFYVQEHPKAQSAMKRFFA